MEAWMFFAAYGVLGVSLGTFLWWSTVLEEVRGKNNEAGHKAVWMLFWMWLISPVVLVCALFSGVGLGLLWLRRRAPKAKV